MASSATTGFERIRWLLELSRAMLRRPATLVVLALVAVLIAYGLGWLQGRSVVARLQAEHARQLASQEETIAGLRAEARAQAVNGQIRGAQLALYRAVFELERRNFGSAQDHVREANDVLQSVRAGDAAISATDFDRARNAVRDINVLVAEDVATQRNQLLGLVNSLEALLRTNPR